MGDPVSMFQAGSAALAGIAGKNAYDMLNPDLPDPAKLPAEVEEVDIEAQKKYTKQRLKDRKGRASTILGSSNTGLKTVLG